MKRLPLFGILLFVFFQGVTQGGQFTLGEKEAGQKIVLHCGDVLEVRLPANPTTGFLWSVSSSKTGVVTQQGNARYQQSAKEKGLLGGGGEEIWHYRAEHDGQTVLTFSYARPWEKGIAPARVFEWSVTVIP